MPGFSPIWLLLLFFQLFIVNVSHAQNKNNLAALVHKSISTNSDNEDEKEIRVSNVILQVDSIANTNTIASYFCKAYSNSMKNIAMQIKGFDFGAKIFIQKFEVGFANYFLTPYYANTNGNLLNGSVWKCFYSSNQAKPWQLILLGVNAHINGDFCHVLVDNFSEQVIRRYKRKMLALQPSIVKVYDDVFDTIRSQSSYLRCINFVTLGLAKKIGERTFFKWRKRAVNLAIMYYHNPEKFKRKEVIVNKKKQKIDKQILSYRSSATN